MGRDPGNVTLLPGTGEGVLATPAQAKLLFLLIHTSTPSSSLSPSPYLFAWRGKPMGEFGERFGLSFVIKII